jgi:SAM-dependent methyltransferase
MYDPEKDLRLLNLDNYRGRLTAFLKLDQRANLNGLKVLVVGSSFGGECFVALELGASTCTGLEIRENFTIKSREIEAGLNLDRKVDFITFDGKHFPCDGFDLVISGHVIEHTPNPKQHLMECMTVLNPGGFIYLEFPTRYNWIELHTSLVGFEYLPKYLKNWINAILANYGKYVKKNEEYAQLRNSMKGNNQVSTIQVRLFLFKLRLRTRKKFKIRNKSRPATGIVRLIIS